MFEEWIERGLRNLKGAEVLQENDCGNELVAFHSQQAIEKILKAYILYKTKNLISRT